MKPEVKIFPRVSVIIVNYNGLKWLKLFMPSIIRTQYPDFEIIVVDNGSKDTSIEYLSKNFVGVRLVSLQENKGTTGGANAGVMHSTGDVLAFLNNDMEVSSDWLIKAILKLTSDPAIAAVQCKILRYYTRNEIDLIGISVDRYSFLKFIGYGEPDEGQYDNLEEIGACSTGAMVMWKHIFDQVGGLDDLFFMYHDDVDLSWRIKLAGYKICLAPSAVVYHVGSASSNVRSSHKYNPSPFFAFLNSRNIVYLWLKNSSLENIVLYWPAFLFGNLLVTLFLFASVSPAAGFAYFKGLFWPIRHTRYILRQRKGVKRTTKGRKDNILFVQGIIKESSNLSNMMKKSPSVLKSIIRRDH